ncbi:MAG: hypothetical protein LGR52_15065 [Candidatus Thiosymbion ectosymbiont of Robbea hypermnestra]|nr:hypothetical protein [Candidatus Thiosymbion ectosymbiont of Robbea hypermnestra]
MSETSFPIRAYRFVYGKVVQQPGGPVEPSFEHCPTSISQRMPDWLLAYCRPIETPGPIEQPESPRNDACSVYPVQLGSTSPTALVHPAQTREGALYFSPCSCDGQRYMVATRLRARPEQGDGGLGRTHTQLVSFAFQEAGWNRHAPRLLANADRWLRAEPDTIDFHKRGDHPMAAFGPAQLPEIPPCGQGPLPPPGNLLWRLAAAVENPDTNLLIGGADRIDTLATFLRALACTAALLPRPLRIYLTAAAGFREPQTPFALQYLPDAPALPPAKAPSFFAQAALQLLDQEPDTDQARWQSYWEAQTRHDQYLGEAMQRLTEPQPAGGGIAARKRIREVIDWLVAQGTIRELEDWLDGKRQGPPKQPELHHPETGASWIACLTQRLDDIAGGKNRPGVARALIGLASLIDTDGDEQVLYQQAFYWIQAWRSAVRNAPETHKRAILRWSTLSTSPLLEYQKYRKLCSAIKNLNPMDYLPPDSPDIELGRFRDFSELGAVAKVIRYARTESPEAAERVDRIRSSDAFDRRLTNLRAQADQLLVLYPRSLLGLAEAYPALLKPRPGDSKSLATSVTETLAIIWIATRHYHWTNQSPPEALAGLGEAARIVAQESFGIRLDDVTTLQACFPQGSPGYLHGALRRYWQWALTPDANHKDPVWPAAIQGILEQHLSRRNLASTLNLLWSSYQPAYQDVAKSIDVTKLAVASKILSESCLQTLAPPERKPVFVAIDLLQAIPDPAQPIPQAEPSRTFADALWQRILDAVADKRIGTAFHDLEHRLLPIFNATLQPILENKDYKPLPETTRRFLDLFDQLLKTWLKHGIPPRAAVTEILDRLEALTERTPGALTKDDPTLLKVIQGLARSLGACLLAWTCTDPPEPWSESTRELKQSPIRRELAQVLGSPLAAYFGGLIPAGSDSKAKSITDALGAFSDNRRAELVGYLCQPPRSAEQYRRVIAFGAARCWRALFMKGKPGYGMLKQLLDAKDSQKDNRETLRVIANLITTTPDWSVHLDPETRFTVAFFVSLQDPTSPAARVEFPPPLRKTLLSNGAEYLSSYPIRLGRLIAGGNFDLGDRFRQLFKAPEKNRLFSRRIMLLPGSGWTGFLSLEPDEKRLRMLRALFALSLIRAEEAGKPDKTRIRFRERDILQAMQIQDSGAKNAVTRFFSHQTNRDYAEAFQAAIGLAGLK